MSARVVLLCAVLALGARAQSLSLQGAPLSLRLGGRTQGVTVERRAANGLPVTSGNTMVVVTAPPGGQVSLGPEPFSAWSAMVTVSILPGSSLSPPVFLRSGRRGLADWSAMAGGYTSATVTVLVRDDALTCDLASGTRLDTELPPGCFNVSIAPYPQSSLTNSMAAAHRGALGLRLVDGDSALGNAADTALFDDTAPTFGDFTARSWVRVVATNGLGAPIIAQLTNAQGQSPSLIDVKLRANLDLVMGGFGADAGYSEFAADAGLTVGTWHLLEFTITGAGSIDGGRAVWLDGRLVLEQRSVDFSGARMSVGRLALGEPYADDRRWLGTIDFDDVRSAGVPLASRLEVQAPDGGFLGECLPFEVQARASIGGGLASLGEAAPIELDAGGGASLFVDPACTVPGEEVVMPADASVATLSFRASRSSFVLLAATPDLLSTPRAIAVLAPPPMNLVPSQMRVAPGGVLNFGVTGGTGRGVNFRMTANPSGGTVDSTGRYQAGNVTGVLDRVEAQDSAGQSAMATVDVFTDVPDAGEPDAGVLDAGVDDRPRALGVGCGCSTSGAPSLAMFLLASLARRRSRVRD